MEEGNGGKKLNLTYCKCSSKYTYRLLLCHLLQNSHTAAELPSLFWCVTPNSQSLCLRFWVAHVFKLILTEFLLPTTFFFKTGSSFTLSQLLLNSSGQNSHGFCIDVDLCLVLTKTCIGFDEESYDCLWKFTCYCRYMNSEKNKSWE